MDLVIFQGEMFDQVEKSNGCRFKLGESDSWMRLLLTGVSICILG